VAERPAGRPGAAEARAAAEAEVHALRLQRDTLRRQLDDAEQELERLRRVTDALLRRLAEVLEQLRRTRAAGRQVTPGALAAAFARSIEAGARTLEGRTVAAARADIRAALQVEQDRAGLVVGDPRGMDPGSLSTITIDLRPVPLGPAGEAQRSGLTQVLAAILGLQRALDREVPPAARQAAEAAVAAASELAAEPPEASRLGARLAALTGSLRRLADLLPELARAVAGLERRRAALAPEPSAADLSALAAALGIVTDAVAGLPR
jgi:hypothetical protein